MKRWLWQASILAVMLLMTSLSAVAGDWGTGALMVIIERENSSVLVVDSARDHKVLGRVEGLGVLHHASMVFSRDGRYGFIVSRDGLLSKIDLLELKLAGQVKIGESSIGVAVTQDNKYVAVSNYKPGNIVIASADDLKIVKTIEADKSKTVGLADAPDDMLVVSLMDANAIWIIDAGQKDFPVVRKYEDVGVKPYDGLLTPDGRYYIAGMFNSPWVAMIDLWNPDKWTKINLPEPKEKKDLPPVLKIPHLRGWVVARDEMFIPVVGGEGLAVVESGTGAVRDFIQLPAHPVFGIVSPDLRRIWVNYAMGDHNADVDIIDVATHKVIKSISPGKKIFHMQFTPKGKYVYVSSNGDEKVIVYDAKTFTPVKEIPAKKPSGVFSSARSSQFGM